MRRTRLKKIDEAERVVHDPEKAARRTMDRAVRLLAAKPRSIGELRTRLLEKIWTNERIVDEVLAKLEGYGYLDDAAYAAGFAASCLRRAPQGKRRLQQALSQKQLDRETVEQAIAGAFAATPETSLIDLAIEKRIRVRGTPETREDLKKLYDYLLRRGFEFSLVMEKLSSFRKPGDET